MPRAQRDSLAPAMPHPSSRPSPACLTIIPNVTQKVSNSSMSAGDAFELIKSKVPASQRHIVFHGQAELTFGDVHKSVIVAQTPHFLYVFGADDLNEVFHKHVFEFLKANEDGSTVTFGCRNRDSFSLAFSGSSADFFKLFIRVFVGACDLKGQIAALTLGQAAQSRYRYSVGMLDPSQKFTFGYPAIASEYGARYYSDVSAYYHTCLENRKAFFEVNEVPVFGAGFSEPLWLDRMELNPVFAALKFSPFIIGCHVENVRFETVPTVWWAYFAGIKKYLILKNLALTSGAGEISRHLKNAARGADRYKSDILFWDFSGNRIEDIGKFTKVLRKMDIRARGMVMERMDMNENALIALFESLKINQHLHKIEEIRLAGSKITKQVLGAFDKWCATVCKKGNTHLRIMSIGPVHNVAHIMSKLKDIPLVRLMFYRSKIDKNGASALAKWIACNKSLNSLGLPGCIIKKKGLKKILQAVTGLPKIGLNLAEMELTGKLFAALMNALHDGLAEKLKRLTLDRNPLTLEEFTQLSQMGRHMKQMKMIFLRGVISPEWRNSGQLLLSLLQPMERLESVTLAGTRENKLNAIAVELLQGLMSNTTIRHLNLMTNNIGDRGLNVVAEFINEHKAISRLEIDGCGLTDPKPLQNYLAACAHNKNIIDVHTPNIDITTVLNQPSCSEDDKVTIHRLLAEMKKNILMNRLNQNITTSLAFRDDPVLKDILQTDHKPLLDPVMDPRDRNWKLSGLLAIDKPFDSPSNKKRASTDPATDTSPDISARDSTPPRAVEETPLLHHETPPDITCLENSDSYSDLRILSTYVRSNIPDDILGDLL